MHQCEAVRNISCVRRSVRSTAARTRRTSAAVLRSSCAFALAAARDDPPKDGDAKPVASGSCTVGAGFAISHIGDAVDVCRPNRPSGVLCSGAVASGSTPCACRPDGPANARTHAVMKASFIAISCVPEYRAASPTLAERSLCVPEYRRNFPTLAEFLCNEFFLQRRKVSWKVLKSDADTKR